MFRMLYQVIVLQNWVKGENIVLAISVFGVFLRSQLLSMGFFSFSALLIWLSRLLIIPVAFAPFLNTKLSINVHRYSTLEIQRF